MSFNGKAMMAVAMMLATTAAVGCKRPQDKAADESAPAPVVVATTPEAPKAEPAAAAAPATTDEGVNVKASVKVNTQPPADRYESPGRAPSRDHRWIKGHWRHEGARGYVWTPGRWTISFATSAPPAPRYENPGRPHSADHVWVPGHWERGSRDWQWVGGHWTVRRHDHHYMGARWERRGARYEYVPGHWVRR